MTEQLALTLGIISLLVIALGLIINKLQEHLLTEPLVAMLLGVLLGPVGLHVLDMERWGEPGMIMELAARLTLAIAVMAAALRLSSTFPGRAKGYLAAVLLLVMPLMALTNGLFIHWISGLPLLLSLLIGAILSPTDPVASSPIVSGVAASKYLPGRLRDAISFESGANDGLALLLVMLFVLLLQASPADAMTEWFFKVLLWETLGGIALGLLIGWSGGKLLHLSHEAGYMNTQTLLPFSLALTFFTLALESLIGMNGIIGTFAAGIALNEAMERKEDLQQSRVQQTMERLVTIPAFFLFGLIAPLSQWVDLGWRGLLIVAAVLLLRRLPWFILMQPFVSVLEQRRDAAMVGWFGPIGIASIFYVFYVAEIGDFRAVWPIVSLVVFASTIVHGVSSYPLSRYYGQHVNHSDD